MRTTISLMQFTSPWQPIALLAIITVFYCAACVSFAIVGKTAFHQILGRAKSFGLLFERGRTTFVVATVIYAVIALGLFDRLTEGAVAILSAIIGFGLGQAKRSAAAEKGEEPEEEEEEYKKPKAP